MGAFLILIILLSTEGMFSLDSHLTPMYDISYIMYQR
jgi:hypothetical protein